MEQVTYVLNTSVTTFAHWLSNHTEWIHQHKFPPESSREGADVTNQYYSLQPAQRPSRAIGERPITLTMNCFYVVETEEGKTFSPEFWAIRFRITPLVPGQRIEVIAECNHDPVMVYFEELLMEMEWNWPLGMTSARTIDVPTENGAGDLHPVTDDTLDPLDRKIIQVVREIEDEGLRATDERVAKRLPLNPVTSEPYHRVTINRRRNSMRDKHYKV